MKNYKVTITETLEKEVVVKAKTAEDALSKVRQDYSDAVYVLDADKSSILVNNMRIYVGYHLHLSMT